MAKQNKAPLCKQISLHLVQGQSERDVALAGDCLMQDCILLLSGSEFEAGQKAALEVDFFGQSFTVKGLIKTCRQRPDELWTMQFKIQTSNILQTRMLIQLSRMEQYRNEMATKGRLLSIDEAACEWIQEHAEAFAKEFDAIEHNEENHE